VNCINEETIERLLDSDLDEKEMEGVSAHLAQCEICLENVMAVAASDKELLNRLKGSGQAVPHMSPKGGCLSKKLLLGYVADGLDDAYTKLVESHLKECNSCLVQMTELQKKYLKEAEFAFDTEAMISAYKEVHHEDILTIVLKDVGSRIFEVIETTGTILATHFPAMESVRGKEPPSEGNAVHIRKDFPDRNISAEVAVKKGETPDTCDIRLSLMRMKGNEVIGATEPLKVLIKGGDVEDTAVTDGNGETEFKCMPLGDYSIMLDRGIEVEVRMQKGDR
jgi:hypothetical protein